MGSEDEEPIDKETKEEDADNNPNLWIRMDNRMKVERRWTFQPDGVAGTTYSRPRDSSYFMNIQANEWNDITPTDIFLRNLPANELQLWVTHTNPVLASKNLNPTNIIEMKHLLGVILAITQSSKVGGIGKAFEVQSDGLFPAANLGRFGMSHKRFKEVFNNWVFGDFSLEDEDNLDAYWETDQLIDRFNEHYKGSFHHSFRVNCDERMWWMFTRQQPGGVKKVDRKPRGTGQEAKTLSAGDIHVTTTFEHVRAATTRIGRERKYMQEYGAAAAVVMRLCEKAGIDGSQRQVVADSWFANLSLVRGLQHLGLHLLGMIKQGDGGFPKKELVAKVQGAERGAWSVATTEVDGKKVIGVAWKGKSEKVKGKKGKITGSLLLLLLTVLQP